MPLSAVIIIMSGQKMIGIPDIIDAISIGTSQE
jgi:hypothetical protein